MHVLGGAELRRSAVGLFAGNHFGRQHGPVARPLFGGQEIPFRDGQQARGFGGWEAADSGRFFFFFFFSEIAMTQPV